MASCFNYFKTLHSILEDGMKTLLPFFLRHTSETRQTETQASSQLRFPCFPPEHRAPLCARLRLPPDRGPSSGEKRGILPSLPVVFPSPVHPIVVVLSGSADYPSRARRIDLTAQALCSAFFPLEPGRVLGTRQAFAKGGAPEEGSHLLSFSAFVSKSQRRGLHQSVHVKRQTGGVGADRPQGRTQTCPVPEHYKD